MSEKEMQIMDDIAESVQQMTDEQKRDLSMFCDGFRQGVAVMSGQGEKK